MTTEPTLDRLKAELEERIEIAVNLEAENENLREQLAAAISLLTRNGQAQNETDYLAFIDERREFFERMKGKA